MNEVHKHCASLTAIQTISLYTSNLIVVVTLVCTHRSRSLKCSVVFSSRWTEETQSHLFKKTRNVSDKLMKNCAWFVIYHWRLS